MTPKIPRKSVNAVERLLSELRTYMSEAERSTSMRVGGYMILRSSVADRLNASEERIRREAQAIRSGAAGKLPLALEEVLSKIESSCPLSKESLAAKKVASTPLKLEASEMLCWTFWEGRKNDILDIEELLGPAAPRVVASVKTARAALTSRQHFVLHRLEAARLSRPGKGLTAPELWSQQERRNGVSEDRIRRIIRALREMGFPIANSGNRGGYILLRPVEEVLRELGFGPSPTA